MINTIKNYVIVVFISMSLILFAVVFFWRSDTDWPEYNGDGERSHYANLNQINTSNVSRLKVAWTYASGGADTLHHRTQMQCNPISIDGILYGVSANTQAFAIKADTGEELWKTGLKDNGGTTSRGLTYWSKGEDERIFFGAGRWIYALNARTGTLIKTFGEQGRIDMKTGIERPDADNYVTSNTPNTIYKDLLITGVRVSESESALLGDIRAYDVLSGKLIWTFRTIPAEGDPGYDTWYPVNPRTHLGGVNSWMGMAIDRKRGIVFVPTGSAAYDFYGGNRAGDNLYANCLLALDARNGALLWYYQIVHHDIWDRDLPAPPNLLTITSESKKIDVVAVVTKQGHTFVFDRETGVSIFPIEHIPFSQEGMPGEVPSSRQPIPVLPVPFTRQSFTVADLNPFVADRDSVIEVLENVRTGSPYIPITEKMTIIFPGTDGGAQWGGAATDPWGNLYVPAKEIPVYTSLLPRDKELSQVVLPGRALYNLYCAACHGKDLNGSYDGSYPGLLNLKKRYTRKQILQVMVNGRGLMPSFSHISGPEQAAILHFLEGNETAGQAVTATKRAAIPYQHTGYNRWYDSNGYPVNIPPWGTLTSIDLNTGKKRWQVPLGEFEDLVAKGMPPTGTDNIGGPLATAGGLIFIAATPDEKIRAFDQKNGRLLWEYKLPAAGYATPSTYTVNGRQYIVIACGGGRLGAKSGDQYVAFSLRNEP